MITKNDIQTQEFKPQGGLNTLGDPFALGENESPKCQDDLFGEDGSLSHRYGYERLNNVVTGATDVCNGLFDYGVSPGVRKLVGAWGTKLLKMDDLDGTWDSLETGRTDTLHFFERSGTRLIICNRARDTIKYWDGSAATLTALNTNAPSAIIPKPFQGYLFLANTSTNPRRIYYEDESTITTGDYGEYFTLPSSSDDEVVALIEYNGRLYASLRTEWYRISFVGGSAIFDYKKVSSVIGAVPRTIQIVSIPNMGEVVMYLGWNKRVYIFDETSSYPISSKYEKNNEQSTIYLDAINQGGLENCHATYDTNKNLYRLYVPIGGDSTITHSLNISLDSLSCSPFANQRFLSSCMAEDSNKKRWHIGGDYYGTAYKIDRSALDEVPFNNIETGTDGSLRSAYSTTGLEVAVTTAGGFLTENVHDGTDNQVYAVDQSVNFGTSGAIVGDGVANKTDYGKAQITAIGDSGLGGTNDKLTLATIGGGTDDDFDDDDVFDVYVGAFVADNDSIYIGSKVKFDCITVDLIQVASATITPTIYYSSDAAGAYTALTVTDGTTGFTKSGKITFSIPSGWTATAKDDGANAFTDTTTYYYVRIQRTANALTTTPKISKIAIGVRIDDNYISPKFFGKNVSELKKGSKINLYFDPMANYKMKYYDRRDFDRTWKERDQIPMYNKKDNFLGENCYLNASTSTPNNQLGSREDGIERSIDVSQVLNSYQYRLSSNKSVSLPFILNKVELAGKTLGIGSSRDKKR